MSLNLEWGRPLKPRTDLVRVELRELEHRPTHSQAIQVASTVRRSAWNSLSVLLSPITRVFSAACRTEVVGDRPGPIAPTLRSDTGVFLMS